MCRVPALLPRADARVHGGVKAPVAVEVVLDQRVLEPEQAHVAVDRPAHADRVARVPAHERGDVDDHVDVRPDRVPDGARDGPVPPLVAAEGDGEIVAPAALHVAVALGHEPAELPPDAVEVVSGEDGRGTGGEPVPPLASEQPVERHAGGLPGDVPQRHVDRADAERDQPAVAVPVGRVAEPAPDARDVARIPAHDQGRQAALDDEGHRQGRLLAARDGLPPAHQPVVGLDADERQRADLAVIVRFRVTNGERLDAADSHEASLVSPRQLQTRRPSSFRMFLQRLRSISVSRHSPFRRRHRASRRRFSSEKSRQVSR